MREVFRGAEKLEGGPTMLAGLYVGLGIRGIDVSRGVFKGIFGGGAGPFATGIGIARGPTGLPSGMPGADCVCERGAKPFLEPGRLWVGKSTDSDLSTGYGGFLLGPRSCENRCTRGSLLVDGSEDGDEPTLKCNSSLALCASDVDRGGGSLGFLRCSEVIDECE